MIDDISFADKVKHTLEEDIKRCLTDTSLIFDDCKVTLDKQYIALDTDKIYWKGTFKILNGKYIFNGEFEASSKHCGMKHRVFSGRPMYDLSISYIGGDIETKNTLFRTKYVRTK